MRLAYFDCFSGITGAMALAALAHAGADLGRISDALAELPGTGLVLEPEDVEARGIAAIRLHVRSGAGGLIRTYSSIRAMLDRADLPDEARRTSQRIFRLLAEADARVHAREVDLVTFHAGSDIDPLAAIVGTALALDQLNVERVFASPVPTGLGMARTEHGMTPIPSPVVVNLLQGAPTYSRGIPVELVTPVGAALLAALAEGYGDMPMMRAEAVGYGAGTLRLDFPHVLRVVVGTEERVGGRPGAGEREEAVLVQARLEVDADVARVVVQDVLTAGASDAWATAVIGPGGRAAAVIHAVADPSHLHPVVRAMGQAGAVEVRSSPLRTHPVT